MPERRIGARAVTDGGASLLLLAAAGYFGYAALQGDTGLVAQLRLEREAVELSEMLARHETRRAELENLAARLGDGAPDPDLLDERARAVLGLSREDEIIVR